MLLEIFKQAITSLTANKARSILTSLGIIIGISAILILNSSGEGIKSSVVGLIQGLGSNIVRVSPQSNQNGPPVSLPKTLKFRDYELIRKNIPTVKYSTPQMFGQQVITVEKESMYSAILGVSEEYFRFANPVFLSGRGFTAPEVRAVGKTIVIGKNVAEKFFLNKDPLNQKIVVGTTSFIVIGVLGSQTGIFGAIQDNAVIMPYTSAKNYIFGSRDWLNAVLLQIDKEENTTSTKEQIISLLRTEHKLKPNEENDFGVTTQEQILNIISSILSVITLFISAVAAISLLVGGIGIMNIMLVTVTERTKEIGLRKAIGAKNSQILLQFLIESVVLTAAGGAIGLAIAWVFTRIANLLSFNAFLTVPAVVFTLAVSSFFGIFFGLYPAKIASDKKPIDALRYE